MGVTRGFVITDFNQGDYAPFADRVIDQAILACDGIGGRDSLNRTSRSSRARSPFPFLSGSFVIRGMCLRKSRRNAASLILLSCIVVGFPALLLIGGSYFQVIIGVGPN